jgi:cell division topological specificity factor
MNLFKRFRRQGSAPLARERLQILLSHERGSRGQSDLLAILRDDILAAIGKQVRVGFENVQVRMNRGANVSTIRIDVEIPNLTEKLVTPVPFLPRSMELDTPSRSRRYLVG